MVIVSEEKEEQLREIGVWLISTRGRGLFMARFPGQIEIRQGVSRSTTAVINRTFVLICQGMRREEPCHKSAMEGQNDQTGVMRKQKG